MRLYRPKHAPRKFGIRIARLPRIVAACMRPQKSKVPTLYLGIRATGRGPRFFKKQIKKPESPIPPGSLVFVKDREGRPVGTGYYNPRSTIALRLIDRGKRPVGPEHVLELLRRACALREKRLRFPKQTDSYRLVHAEGDGLPGLVIDKLGPWLVTEISLRAHEKKLEELGETLLSLYPKGKLLLRVDEDLREQEKIEARSSPAGRPTWIHEAGLQYLITPGAGHKTGHFCDQRENRVAFGPWTRGKRVLDLCCNAGGFAMHAAREGAKEVVASDLDEKVLDLAKENLQRNALRAKLEHGDAFELLRELRAGLFEVVVLDPPKWIHGKSEYERGAARYRDLNREAMKKLGSGGLLVTCSCSGLLSEAAFLEILKDAAAQAGKDLRLLRLAGAGPDHPIDLACPETRYLKVAFLELR